MDDSVPFSANRQIILISPHALSPGFDPTTLPQFIDSAAVRCIVRADDDRGLAFAAEAHRAGLSVEVLLGQGAPKPDDAIHPFAARMPPGTAPATKADRAISDADELALLMTDALFIDGTRDDHAIVVGAKRLHKNQVTRIADIPAVVVAKGDSSLLRLDPLRPSARSRWTLLSQIFGRVELFWISFATLIGLGLDAIWHREHEKIDAEKDPPPRFRKLRKGVRGAFAVRWDRAAWFAPRKWSTIIPDRKAEAPTSAIWRFNTLDRAARFSARVLRDTIWLVHIAAALAVFFSAYGFLEGRGAGHNVNIWPLVELGLLFFCILVPVFLVSWRKLQPRWMASRMAAEQIRAACLSLPIMLLPPSFATEDRAPRSRDTESAYRDQAVALAKRAIRDHGLPFRPPTSDFKQAVAWVRLIVQDQIDYHVANRTKLHLAEHALKTASATLFVLVLLVVLLHFWVHWEGLILVTTAGPAFAAALHGIGTRLDLIHRVHLSKGVQASLSTIRDRLDALSGHPETDVAWTEFRAATLAAANEMGAESENWHRVIQLQAPELP